MENSEDEDVIIPPIDTDSEFESNDSSLFFFANAYAQAEADTASSYSTRRYVARDRITANNTLMEDYFVENPKYNEETFRHRFRMSKRLFLKIVDEVQNKNEWFQEGYDARMKKSFTPIQKITSAIKQLSTGNTPDEYDEYLNMSTRTSRECLVEFCKTIIALYKTEFLRRPTSHDVELLYKAHEERHHIPGMLGSIDCTHFVWRNCPRELRGQYMRGDHQYPTIMLEAVTSQDLWFWHAYCGPPGSLNDINVLQQSTIFHAERNGTAPKCPFNVNGHLYRRGYYLTDGIYPTWSTFVKSFPYPTDPKEKMFKKLQEGARKDVERAFGVLKGKWGILRRPMRPTKKDSIIKITHTCILLHNMILKDEGVAISPVHIMDPPVAPAFAEHVLEELFDQDAHYRLRNDLMEHVASQDLEYLQAEPEDEV